MIAYIITLPRARLSLIVTKCYDKKDLEEVLLLLSMYLRREVTVCSKQNKQKKIHVVICIC